MRYAQILARLEAAKFEEGGAGEEVVHIDTIRDIFRGVRVQPACIRIRRLTWKKVTPHMRKADALGLMYIATTCGLGNWDLTVGGLTIARAMPIYLIEAYAQEHLQAEVLKWVEV